MTFCVAGKRGEDDVAVDLAEGGGGIGEGGQHRAVDGGGAVRPGQSFGKVPHDSFGIVTGGSRAVTENLIAAILDAGAGDVDENGGLHGSDDVDAIELVEGQPGPVDIGALKGKDV